MKFTPLYSGSSGNSSYICSDDVRILIDAGVSAKAITEALSSIGESIAAVNAIIVTHEHIDHVRSVGTLSRKYNIPIYANAKTWEAMGPIIKEVAFSNVRLFDSRRDFYIGGVNIAPMRTSHDAEESVGFIIVNRGRKLAYITDVGFIQEEQLERAAGADLVFIESNHDVDMLLRGPYPYPLKQRILSNRGHLSNADCAQALTRLYTSGVRRAILGHLSKDNNTEGVAASTLIDAFHRQSIYDFKFAIAKRDRATGVFDV